MKEIFLALTICLYNLALFIFTAYLVDQSNWSMWTFAITLCFVMSVRTKDKPTDDTKD